MPNLLLLTKDAGRLETLVLFSINRRGKMEKKRTNEHPEVKDIKNICDIAPKNQHTKNVCGKVNKEKSKSKK